MSATATEHTIARHRWGQLAATGGALGVEVVLYWFYMNGDGAFHWFTHFFAGTSAALAIMTILVSVRRRPVRLPLLWLIVGHLVAMGPDVLFVHEMAHRRWMDVFVAHNVSHFIPGRNVTWYLIFLACLAAYLWGCPGPVVLGRRGTASRPGGRRAVITSREGRPVTSGIHHSAARRRLKDPTAWSAPDGDVVRVGGLALRTLGHEGPPVLLLHGLGGSGRSWGCAYDTLATDRRLIVPDLLGFGRSSHPATGYSPDDHVNAVIACLDALGITEAVTIGAHSLGSLVAIRLAETHPGRVRAIVAFGPPLYPDRPTAIRHIAGTSLMGRLFVLPGPLGHTICAWMCRHRALAGRLAVWGSPGVPAGIAEASVDHTWASYSQTIQQVILDAQAGRWLESLTIPVRLITGADDPRVDLDYLENLATKHPNVTLEVWAGGHDLPLVQADRCAAAIADAS